MYVLTVLATVATAVIAATVPSHSNSTSSNDHKFINERSAQEVISKLNLISNPEKGYFFQTFLDAELVNGNRSASTAIYYLLEGSAGDSVWHRVDAAEVWHWYAGAPLTLSLSWDDGKPVEKQVLGQDIFGGEKPQVIIRKNQWQSAKSHGDWTLVGNTVAPAFDPIGGYKLAPPGWEPKGIKC